MEIETSQSMVAKKVWNSVRIVLFMLRKGIAKSRVMAELNLLLKRGKLAAGKAIANTLTLRHHYAASCHRNTTSFVSPRDYEFSCSNSPAFPKFRNNKHHHRFSHHHYHKHQYDDVLTVQKVLEILNNNDSKVEPSSPFSPLVTLPGFGKSPIGKQLRITDSPFPLKVNEGDEDCHVDIAAEEFIKRFYKDLNLQQKFAAIQSPSPYHNSWDR